MMAGLNFVVLSVVSMIASLVLRSDWERQLGVIYSRDKGLGVNDGGEKCLGMSCCYV